MCQERITNNNPLIPDVPFNPCQIYRPPPKPIRHDISTQGSKKSSPGIEDINPNINFDFKENSPFQEGVISETSHSSKNLKNWGSYRKRKFSSEISTKTDIDTIFKVVQRNVLKGTHLPVDIKEIHARYLHSSYFKDIFLYLFQNKLPSSKAAIKKVKALSK